MSEFRCEPCRELDIPDLLELNESCVPHVNSVSADDMKTFLVQASCFFKLIDRDSRLAGFVIALAPGQDYGSLNYQWFQGHFESFLYIDRIMVSPSFRRRGVAQKIYQKLDEWALEKAVPRLCCEVNLTPPNPESSQLHRYLGFVSVGSQATEGGEKKVDLLVKELIDSILPS